MSVGLTSQNVRLLPAKGLPLASALGGADIEAASAEHTIESVREFGRTGTLSAAIELTRVVWDEKLLRRDMVASEAELRIGRRRSHGKGEVGSASEHNTELGHTRERLRGSAGG